MGTNKFLINHRLLLRISDVNKMNGKENKTKNNKGKQVEQPKEKVITLKSAIMKLSQNFPEGFTIDDMTASISNEYPGRWQESSIRLHINALNLNASEGVQKAHPSIFKDAFLIKKNDKFIVPKRRGRKTKSSSFQIPVTAMA